VSQVGDIREALAEALRVIPGMQMSGWQLSNPTPPFAMIQRGPVDFDRAFPPSGGVASGGTHWTMRVQVCVAIASDIGAQRLLDEFLATEGDRSIKQALETDTTLGGLVQSVHVTDATGEQLYAREQQGGPLLGSEFTVEILL